MPEHVQGASPISSPVLLLEWWKPVVGFEEYYQVSNCGRVCRIALSTGTRPYKPVKWGFHKNGYPVVSLSSHNIVVRKYIHHIVAEAFLGIRPDGLHINHIDANTANPKPSNLEYITPLENLRHAQAMGLIQKGEQRPLSKITESDVREIKSIGYSLPFLVTARKYGVSKSTIWLILKGKSWKHVV